MLEISQIKAYLSTQLKKAGIAFACNYPKKVGYDG
jgi:hypothetical protein